MNKTIFSRLRLAGWRQFDSIDIELHPKLTILTGANGAGKSTLLRIFSRHLGFEKPYLATPQYSPNGSYTYLTGLFSSAFARFAKPREDLLGALLYSNGAEATLTVPKETSVQYQLNISNQNPVQGIHIDSHQPISAYQTLDKIPTNLISAEQAYNNYWGELNNRYNGGYTQFSPMYRMKEALISMATFGEGNKYVQGNKTILQAFMGFIEVLKKLLPESLGFVDLVIRPPEVVLETKSGEFLLDASSGGIMALIDLAWRIYMFSRHVDNFVVTIDEPENHLHPSLQRILMRNLLATFPQVQFIIATHSPFMVSAVRDSSVYVLRYIDGNGGATNLAKPGNHVVSQRLDTINKAGTANEILREVLGVPATIPEWVQEGLSLIVDKYRGSPITEESVLNLRAELNELGYGELYPEALSKIVEGK